MLRYLFPAPHRFYTLGYGLGSFPFSHPVPTCKSPEKQLPLGWEYVTKDIKQNVWNTTRLEIPDPEQQPCVVLEPKWFAVCRVTHSVVALWLQQLPALELRLLGRLFSRKIVKNCRIAFLREMSGIILQDMRGRARNSTRAIGPVTQRPVD